MRLRFHSKETASFLRLAVFFIDLVIGWAIVVLAVEGGGRTGGADRNRSFIVETVNAECHPQFRLQVSLSFLEERIVFIIDTIWINRGQELLYVIVAFTVSQADVAGLDLRIRHLPLLSGPIIRRLL